MAKTEVELSKARRIAGTIRTLLYANCEKIEIVQILREGIHSYPRDVIAGKRPEGFEK